MKIWSILVCFTVQAEGVPVIVFEMQGQPYAVVHIFTHELRPEKPAIHPPRGEIP